MGASGCYAGYIGISRAGGCTPDISLDTNGYLDIFNGLSVATNIPISNLSSPAWQFNLRDSSNNTWIQNNGN
jgi:hypothetical protein